MIDMEKNYLKAFYAMTLFAVSAMVLSVIVVIFGDKSSFAKLGNWVAGFLVVAFAMVFLCGVVCIVLNLMNQAKNKEITDINERIEKLEKSKTKEEYAEEMAKQKAMVDHQERMALIKQLGDGAPNKEIFALLKEKY